MPRLLIPHLTQLLGNSCVDGTFPRHSIELALDMSLAPHAYKGPCLLCRPARRHSRMRVQLMASVRHATGVQSHDLEANPLYPDSNHLAKWIEPNRFQTVLAQCAFSVNANQCALNRIECALSVQCEHALILMCLFLHHFVVYPCVIFLFIIILVY